LVPLLEFNLRDWGRLEEAFELLKKKETLCLELGTRSGLGCHEVSAARERALRAGLASFARDRSPVAEVVRQEFTSRLAYKQPDADAGDATRTAHSELFRGALQAARQAVLAMRANNEIGDDAFHQMEEELDWLEMAGGRKEE
jgi:hypothetical protein